MRLERGQKWMPVVELDAAALKVLAHPVRLRIARAISKGATYPAELARRLRMAEQTVYYHIRAMRKAKIVKVIKKEEKKGGVAKYVQLVAPAYALVLDRRWQRSVGGAPIFGNMSELRIVVGSPDPHGAYGARARDGHLAAELALGIRYESPKPIVFLDTEIKDAELRSDLICIGGPVTNLITARFMHLSPIRIEQRGGWHITSDLSGRRYAEPTAGMIVSMPNPLADGRRIVIIAGNGRQGTRAAILATRTIREWQNVHDKSWLAKVVEGIDTDGDGLVDRIEVKE